MLRVTGFYLIIRGVLLAGFAFVWLYWVIWDLVLDPHPHPFSEPYIMMDIFLAALLLGGVAFGAATALIAGIKGYINWNKPEQARRCVRWGIVAGVGYVFTLLGTVFAILQTSIMAVVEIGFFLIHVLYTIGAYQLKNTPNTAPATAGKTNGFVEVEQIGINESK